MKALSQSLVVKRALATIFILFIYVLGSNLTLPFVDTNSPSFMGGSVANLAYSTALTGGNLRSLSLFSVGLSPWMSAMLLWQMFSLSKTFGKIVAPLKDRGQTYLMFLIALLQSLAVTLPLPVQAGYNPSLVLLMNTMILIAGSFFLVWLSDINAIKGLGGSMVIIMASMVLTLPQNIINSITILRVGPAVVALLFVFALVFLYINVIMMAAKYRIPVNKIGLHNRFKRYSYLDIPLTPAGGMPFMYAMTMTTLPQYILLLIQLVYPNNGWTNQWIPQFNMGTPLWITLYFSIIVILSIAFAYVNVNGEQIAKGMLKSGEYIYGVYPGAETSRFITRKVSRIAVFGAVYTLMMIGLPLLVIFYDARYLQLSMIPGMMMMFSGMMYNIGEEIKALRLNETYKSVF